MNSKVKILVWTSVAVFVICLFVPVFASGSSPVPLSVGLLAFTIAIAVPILLARKRTFFTALWLAVYIVAYGTLSWHGSYIDGNFGGSDNRSVWYPAYCGEVYWSRSGRQKCLLHPLAWFFIPPLIVDRLAIHRTHFDAY